MARLLLVTNGPAGMRFSTIELGRRLRAAGHEVTLLADEPAEPLARQHGLGYRRLEPERAAADANPAAGWLYRWRTRAARREEAIAASGARELIEHLRAVEPDLLLLDGEMQEHVIVAAASGVPLALLNTFASIWRQAGSPPPHTTIRPGEGWQGTRVGVALAWNAFLARKRTREWLRALRQAGADRVSVLRTLAREQGFDFRRGADAGQWLVPRTYPGFPALSLHGKEFEFAPEPPSQVHYLGPLVLRERLDPPLAPADRTRLETLFEGSGPKGEGAPLFYAGFGSFFTAEPAWVKNLFQAFSERPDWSLVLPLGGKRTLPKDLERRRPPNVHVFSWLPQLHVLRHCDAAVVHGGINTIDECVLAGVPMLVCNGRETDMPGNQARVTHHGLGLAADAARDTPEKIVSALDRLRGESSFAEAVASMRRAFEAYEQDAVAEKVIEALLRAR